MTGKEGNQRGEEKSGEELPDIQKALERDLERLRASRPAAPAYLQERIMANLPERDPWQDLLDWLRASTWRPVAAAALPLLLGFTVGLTAGDDLELEPTTESLIFAEVWEAYETDEI